MFFDGCKLTGKNAVQSPGKIAVIDIRAFVGKESEHFRAVLIEMMAHVRQPLFKGIVAFRKIMMRFPRRFTLKNVIKELGAHGVEQIVLCFKMRVKSGASDIGFFQNVGNGNVAVALF